MDLKHPMQLAGRNLINALCPSKGFLPYWHMAVTNEYQGRYEFRPGADAHNIGRWWNAMLRLEQAIGFEIPLEAEAGMLDNLKRYGCNQPSALL